MQQHYFKFAGAALQITTSNNHNMQEKLMPKM